MNRSTGLFAVSYAVVIVTHGESAARSSHRSIERAAIVLTTTSGTIAFEVTLETIPILRREIDLAEKMLRQRPGSRAT